MPNLKINFSRRICAAGQSLVRAMSLGVVPPLCSLVGLRGYRSAAHISSVDGHQQLPNFIELTGKFVGKLNNYFYLISFYDYFNKLLRWENVIFTPILIMYRKLYRNVVSIIVLNIEARQYISRLILLYRAALFPVMQLILINQASLSDKRY